MVNDSIVQKGDKKCWFIGWVLVIENCNICPWKVVEICLSKFVWMIIQYCHVSSNLLMKWHHCYSKSISLVATQLEQRIITCVNDGCTVKPRNHGKNNKNLFKKFGK